jgi:DNA polymerase elongation subunit (family B)
MDKQALYVKEHGGMIHCKWYDKSKNEYVKKSIDKYDLSFNVESHAGEIKSTNGEKVVSIDFYDVKEYKDTLKEYKSMDIPIYNDIAVGAKFLSENFQLSGNIEEMLEYDNNVPRVAWYDIETKIEGDIDTLKTPNEIRSIAVYHTHAKERVVFGFKEDLGESFITTNEQGLKQTLYYHHCKDERDMLTQYAMYIKRHGTDIMIGYNSERFDDAYLINRMINLKIDIPISPFNIKSSTYEKHDQWGGYEKATIIGMNLLDFKKMIMEYWKKLSSYGLDFVAKAILGRGKKTYDGNLNDLYDNDYKGFIEYNMVDVDVLVEMEEITNFLPLMYTLSTIFYVNVEDIQSMTIAYDSIIYNELNQGLVKRS